MTKSTWTSHCFSWNAFPCSVATYQKYVIGRAYCIGPCCDLWGSSEIAPGRGIMMNASAAYINSCVVCVWIISLIKVKTQELLQSLVYPALGGCSESREVTYFSHASISIAQIPAHRLASIRLPWSQTRPRRSMLTWSCTITCHCLIV